MRTIHDLKELKRRIGELETLKDVQKNEIKVAFRDIGHQLSPVTLVKNGIQSMISTPGLKTTAIGTALSSGAGYLGKKLVVNKSHNFFRYVAGMVVEFVVANLVRKKIPLLRRKASN